MARDVEAFFMCFWPFGLLPLKKLFTCVETYSCNKIDLAMIYDLFNVLLNLVCKHFIKDFCICVHQENSTKVFPFVVSLSSFSIRVKFVS
jgi:hypothetical protein